MAGSGAASGFDSAGFRAAIRFAMTMGAPPVTADKATFRFRKTRSFPTGTRLDQEGNPLDPTIAVTVVEPTPVVLDNVAVEFQTADPQELPVGNFRPTKAVLTLLDEEWATVDEAIEVQLGGDTYVIGYVHPPLGLFDVGVIQVSCFGVNEQ